MPVAGKTGTTQNWADAWVVGYSPYFTTAVWFGFDMPGNSMGQGGTGAGLAGPWGGGFMEEIHRGLPHRDFVRPATGVVYVQVCAVSGLLAGPGCDNGVISLPFLQGTQPQQSCDTHGGQSWATTTAINNIRSGTQPLGAPLGSPVALGSFALPMLPEDLFLDLPESGGASSGNLIPALLEPAPWEQADAATGSMLELPADLGPENDEAAADNEAEVESGDTGEEEVGDEEHDVDGPVDE
jgi:membrane peptidoglycan carboxypeptidase